MPYVSKPFLPVSLSWAFSWTISVAGKFCQWKADSGCDRVWLAAISWIMWWREVGTAYTYNSVNTLKSKLYNSFSIVRESLVFLNLQNTTLSPPCHYLWQWSSEIKSPCLITGQMLISSVWLSVKELFIVNSLYSSEIKEMSSTSESYFCLNIIWLIIILLKVHNLFLLLKCYLHSYCQ